MYGDNNTILDTAITYVPGANGSKTALVSTYTNGTDDAYTYAYDVNGNITSITKGSQSFTYEYDAANQLIRENLYYGNGNSNNATYTYTYDKWGNILKKSRYAYTVSDLPSTALSEITYGYNYRNWGDLLTSYNGQTITYDAMGNPTSYRGKTLSWEGKQLLSVSQSYNGTPLYEYSFAYNEDGLRTRKEIALYGIVGSTTDYYYNGSVLIGMSNPDAVQRFSYDASGKVVSVDFSADGGSTYTTYYYLRNAQGDIVKLIDGSGSTVVEYIYDSWGKVLSTTGTLAGTVGIEQPFRYRGYVYDRETQWYYLQSRYYDPTTGRFISADVLLSTGQGVIGHNSFAYCKNNPVCYCDPFGFECVTIDRTDLVGPTFPPIQLAFTSSSAESLLVVVASIAAAVFAPIVMLIIPESSATETTANLQFDDIDFSGVDTNHIINGTGFRGGHNWGNFNIDPNDPNAWDRIHRLIMEVLRNPDQVKSVAAKGGTLYYLYKYFSEADQEVCVKIWQETNSLIAKLSNAYPVLP